MLPSSRTAARELIESSYYQEYLSKNLTEKYGNLNTQVDKLVNDANAEIENLTNKVQCQHCHVVSIPLC